MDDIWNLGGYGIYVWPAYALSLGLLILLTLYLSRRLKKSTLQLEQWRSDET